MIRNLPEGVRLSVEQILRCMQLAGRKVKAQEVKALLRELQPGVAPVARPRAKIVPVTGKVSYEQAVMDTGVILTPEEIEVFHKSEAKFAKQMRDYIDRKGVLSAYQGRAFKETLGKIVEDTKKRRRARKKPGEES
jgi:hypothetical protein